jgi:hypothetical protein
MDGYEQFIPIADGMFKYHARKIIRNQKGLYLLVDQSGQVYQATSETNDQIEFVRVDSTYFSGYNGSSIDFSYRDTIYSLGGYGFWRMNGQLRYFSELNHEWNIEKINEEFPVNEFIYNLLPAHSKLLYVQWPFEDEATGQKFADYRVVELDLDKKKNTELGIFTKEFSNLLVKATFPINRINLPSLHSVLIAFNSENQYLLNFEKNEVYRLANTKIKDLFYGNSKGVQPINSFEYDNKIFYTLIHDTTFSLHSVPISINDFIKEPFALYEPAQSSETKSNIYIIALLTGATGLTAFFFRKRISNKLANTIKPNPDINTNKNQLEFNAIEMELINKIISKSKKGEHFSVEEINSTLGLSKKSFEIQKKIRTETINRINHKFKLKFNLSAVLIERARSEDDRRFFEYKITNENILLMESQVKV